MPNPSTIPVRRVFDARLDKVTPDAGTTETSASPSTFALPSISPVGPRKLIRPPMPRPANGRGTVRLSPLSSLQPTRKHGTASAGRDESSHAEAFYFQKQIHSQTLMIVVLEDGEQIEGQIEWYDRDAIKVRHGNVRTLVYKAGIKYLYKAADKTP